MTLADIIMQKLGVMTKAYENPLVAEVGTDVVQILPNNPNRLGYSIINMSANIIYVAWSRNVGPTHGVLLTPNGGSTYVEWAEDFEMCCWSVFAVAAAPASDIYIVAVDIVGPVGKAVV